MKHQDTEVYAPVPPTVTPGKTDTDPPSDAIILFDGKNQDEWVSAQDHTPARWIVTDGTLKVSKEHGVGNIETKKTFKDYQLHIEWKIPTTITGSDQARGNSGVFLASTGPGDAGYELQVLDSCLFFVCPNAHLMVRGQLALQGHLQGGLRPKLSD